MTQGYQQIEIKSTRLTDAYCSSTDNYDVASFNSTDLHAQNIGANQYKFIFTEVNEDRTPISNPEVFESIRNSNSTRLIWASNSNGDRLTHLDKTYKVEVQGIFQSIQSAIKRLATSILQKVLTYLLDLRTLTALLLKTMM